MKKTIITMTLALLSCSAVNAQIRDIINDPGIISEDERILNGESDININYYAGKSTVKGNTVTFKVTDAQKKFNLGHKEYILINELNTVNPGEVQLGPMEVNPWRCTTGYTFDKVRACIPDAIAKNLSKCCDYLGLWLCVDVNTGAVLEVRFALEESCDSESSGSIFSIPPQVFEKIEKKIKEEVKLVIREEYRTAPRYFFTCDKNLAYLFK